MSLKRSEKSFDFLIKIWQTVMLVSEIVINVLNCISFIFKKLLFMLAASLMLFFFNTFWSCYKYDQLWSG